jgi:hypothetical protein
MKLNATISRTPATNYKEPRLDGGIVSLELVEAELRGTKDTVDKLQTKLEKLQERVENLQRTAWLVGALAGILGIGGIFGYQKWKDSNDALDKLNKGVTSAGVNLRKVEDEVHDLQTTVDKFPGISQAEKNRLVNEIQKEVESKGFLTDTLLKTTNIKITNRIFPSGPKYVALGPAKADAAVPTGWTLVGGGVDAGATDRFVIQSSPDDAGTKWLGWTQDKRDPTPGTEQTYAIGIHATLEKKH